MLVNTVPATNGLKLAYFAYCLRNGYKVSHFKPRVFD